MGLGHKNQEYEFSENKRLHFFIFLITAIQGKRNIHLHEYIEVFVLALDF